MVALSKGLESSQALNKLKTTRLFKTLANADFFTSDEVKGILDYIRLEYRKSSNNLDYIRDTLIELKSISNSHPYEIHSCFASDIKTQYEDFQNWRLEETKKMANDELSQLVHTVKSSFGLTIDLFMAEMEAFCRTKECLGDILYLCAHDFYNNLYIDNQKQHIWTKEYLDTACRIVDGVNLGQQETDEVVERMLEHIFVEAKRIFETSSEPVFMPKEYAEPFYHLLRQSCKTLSKSKAEVLLGEIIKVFSEFAPQFEERVK